MMKSNVIWICILISISIFFVGCEGKDSAKETVAEPNETVSTTQLIPPATGGDIAGGVAVIVNGVEIMEDVVQSAVEQQMQRYGGMIEKQPGVTPEKYRELMRGQVLRTIIGQMLLEQKVKKDNITVSEEEIDNYVSQMAESQGMTLENLKSVISLGGKNYSEWKESQRPRCVVIKLLESQWPDGIKLSPEDVNAFYNENRSSFLMPERVRARHILIKPDTSDPNTDAEQAKTAAREKAELLLQQVKTGSDFAELAKSNSNCPSSARGGDLGFFPRGNMVKPFEDAAFGLEKDGFSDIVETQFGYHIIQVTDHNDPGIIPFDEVKDRIESILVQRKKLELTENYVQSLMSEADIVYPAGKEPVEFSTGSQ